MFFYDLPKEERQKLVIDITKKISEELRQGKKAAILPFFSDEDTYIRKSAYLAVGRIYTEHTTLRTFIIQVLESFMDEEDFKVRQTAINAAGEIGKRDFEIVRPFFDTGLFDSHHSPRNAVIGSIKKMGEVNPKPILAWAKEYLHHPDKEIRREICHGIELRGRTHPEEILPLLKELQHDQTTRVKNTLVHVIGQIAYKKGCLETVIADLNTWNNQELAGKALDEIIDVHYRYRNFSYLSQDQARDYIEKNYSPGISLS